MNSGFETIGNATLVFFEEGQPVLATDPWLKGTCYFGSWALDHPLPESELKSILDAPYIWISHGHPDHLHPESLELIGRDKKILLPDHYVPDIAKWLQEQGFNVEILPYRQWRQLSPNVRCLCLDNENQDAILIVEIAGCLVVNMNDSPFAGEKRFIRNLVANYERSRTYLCALCAVDADMLNIVDREGRRVIGPPSERKRGMIWTTARKADRLGVGNFVCSSSQHIYVRKDSVWANPYRIQWSDIQQHWSRPNIRIVEPFVRINLPSGQVERKCPEQRSDETQVTNATADDDYSEVMSEADWQAVERFLSRFELIRPHFDFVEFVVAGERRRFWLSGKPLQGSAQTLRGFSFHVPRKSLMSAVESGYFDDLLIGNFMKTELHNATLYPNFTPNVSKLGGNARVFTRDELGRFHKRYLRRNRLGYWEWQIERAADKSIDLLRSVADRVGIKAPLRRIYRKLIGDPVP